MRSFKEKKRRAAADGYEDGVEVLYKRPNASQFVETPDALAFLADTSEIALDGEWATHRATTDEIRELIRDIKGMPLRGVGQGVGGGRG
jgi:hypothetical protein